MLFRALLLLCSAEGRRRTRVRMQRRGMLLLSQRLYMRLRVLFCAVEEAEAYERTERERGIPFTLSVYACSFVCASSYAYCYSQHMHTLFIYTPSGP
jgi:hypothetical protein